jgi:hypothetical protein
VPRQYWEELVEIHAFEIYIRLWRNQLSSRLLWIKVVRAIAASGGVAGWAIWKGYPTFWGCIIAGAQLADVAVQALPERVNDFATVVSSSLSSSAFTLRSSFLAD